jgi:outer membrane protein OmpA-like peptidoglycan-associated protein
MPARPAAAILLLACAHATAWAVTAADIKQRQGLVLTDTIYASVVSSAGNFNYMDTEEHISLEAVTGDGLTYQIKPSAPGNQKVQAVAAKLRWPRHVRREDLENAARVTLLTASTDPKDYPGQTFQETSRKVLATLKASGETALVIGVYASGDSDPLDSLAAAPSQKSTPQPHATGVPILPDPGQMFHMLFGSARRYYRGTLHRVEPQDVPVAVLVNGVSTELPAVHAAGDFTFGQDKPVRVEVWWLDNPDWPLSLHWQFGEGSTQITKIDWAGAPGDDVPGGAGAAAAMANQLASKSCRVELHGIYFDSGSAVLLEESEPMLKQVAQLVKASQDTTLTIEGHTDNIGSADYNQKLSEERAAAVRDALVTRYAIPANRLTAKGYGLTRPVDNNATVVGRAHNRRVELARPCAGH